MPTKRNRKIKNKNKKKLKNKKTMKYKMKGGGGEHIKYFTDDQYKQIIELYPDCCKHNFFEGQKDNNIGLTNNSYSITNEGNIEYYFIYISDNTGNTGNSKEIYIPVIEFDKHNKPLTFPTDTTILEIQNVNIPEYNINNINCNIMLSEGILYKFTEIWPNPVPELANKVLPNPKTGLGNNAPNGYIVVNS